MKKNINVFLQCCKVGKAKIKKKKKNMLCYATKRRSNMRGKFDSTDSEGGEEIFAGLLKTAKVLRFQKFQANGGKMKFKIKKKGWNPPK
ncbi:unnamed protein product, partial [Sphenostylis stenocarpa]